MLQSIVLSCYPFHILLLVRIVANHGWTLQQGSIPASKISLFFFPFFLSFLFFRLFVVFFLSSSFLFLCTACTRFNMGWVFQLSVEVSSKLAVILPIQLLGLKWEFKVNFMQI